ncbi:MAG: phosphomannomutase/phosphoglucomutase, partial [Bacillota bacterium]|nr:phosphomannomutase/phosphoglucomutase [Bacillota bacterium]
SVAAIASAYGVFLKQRNFNTSVLGYDNRASSKRFAEIAADSLRKQGITVYDIGLSVTPMVYYAQYLFHSPGAMMITASHNPADWNGMKMAIGYSRTMTPEHMKKMHELAQKVHSPSKNPGKMIQIDVREDYLNQIVSRFQNLPQHNLRVVVDCANGAAGVFAYELFQMLGCKTFQLHCDPDDQYPNYFPNPSDSRARRRMKEMVVHPYIRGDLAMAFDGDGDRLGVVDSRGRDVWSDRLLIPMAASVLRKEKGASIVYDVKCSRALTESIQTLGGVGIMAPTGHSHIKEAVRRYEAPLGGERSGHIFWSGKYYWGYDDALFAASSLIALMAKEEANLDELLNPYPKYEGSPEYHLSCPEQRKYEIVNEVMLLIQKEFGKEKTITINGVRLELEDGWGLVRASSNLPELVVVLEGRTKDALNRMETLFREILAKFAELGQWQY